jgi:uncharacterized protein (UPF0216 family)
MKMDRLLKVELERLNLHLPKERISLYEALSSAKPHVVAKNGSIHSFKREELELLGKMVGEEAQKKLRLPILISIEPRLGRGAARVTGEVEVKVVSQLLGKEGRGDELIIYRPEIALLRRKLPTTSQYLFMCTG